MVSLPLNKIVELVIFAALFALSILSVLGKLNNLLNSPSWGVRIILFLFLLFFSKPNNSLGFFWKDVRPSASKTNPISSLIALTTNSLIIWFTPLPGPIINVLIFFSFTKLKNSSVLFISFNITEVRWEALTTKALVSDARVTAPAPDRKAETAAKRDAPVDVSGPDLTRIWPLLYLWSDIDGHLKFFIHDSGMFNFTLDNFVTLEISDFFSPIETTWILPEFIFPGNK